MADIGRHSRIHHEYGALVEVVREHLVDIHGKAEAFIMAVYDLGILLRPVETIYGEGTIHRLATDVDRSESYLYKARAFAEAWTVEALQADMERLRGQGRTPSLSYYWRALVSPGQYAVENLERRAMTLDEDCEEVKAAFPEQVEVVEAVDSIQVVVRETNRDLHERVSDGALDDYYAWLRQQPCIFCGDRSVEIAHLPTSRGAGGSRVLPLCVAEHRLIHQIGMAKFLGMDVVRVEVVERLLIVMADLFVACYGRRGGL